jgi:membrane protein YqaA with SNARE-associated domain
MGEAASLWTVFSASFLAATLLPGGSEVVLFGVLKSNPGVVWSALLVATIGNTLGGLTSYCIGRVLPEPTLDAGSRRARWQIKARALAKRYGSAAMLLAWMPIIGDPLCVAAGWLRLHWLPVTLFMALGKAARYLVVVLSAV